MGITPVTRKTEWRSRTDLLPHWSGPRVPTIVVAPHPDDETLAAGGLIRALRSQHIPVTVIAVTDGESAYAGVSGLGPVREREQTAALLELGVPPSQTVRLRLPDSDVTARAELLCEGLRSAASPGSHLLAPWPHDFHPDHEVCGRAAASIAHELGLPLTFYIFWTWHRGAPDLLSDRTFLFPLSRMQQEAKLRALACHESQLRYAGQQPILPDELLWPPRLPYEVFVQP